MTVLLSHYWTAAEHEALREAQLMDWLSDLGEFPASVVAAAVAEWRRSQAKRPTPADIRRLCREQHVARTLPALPSVAPRPALPEGLVRPDFVVFRVADMTRAEFALIAAERRREASAAGYGDDPDAWHRMVRDRMKAAGACRRASAPRPVARSREDGYATEAPPFALAAPDDPAVAAQLAEMERMA